MTIHKNGVISANHGNDELYTTQETSEQVVSYYKDDLQKYDTVLMPFNSIGSKLEAELKKVHNNVVAFDTDFFEQDFSQYKNAVIFDNPPFSKFGKVLKRTSELGFDYYLFGNSMSLFHHLRREYVTGFNMMGDNKFDNAYKVVNVGIYTNTNDEITNTFNHTKSLKQIELTPGERYTSGKVISRLRNAQVFKASQFSNYSSEGFGGSMIFNG